jgi:hypothetical protein
MKQAIITKNGIVTHKSAEMEEADVLAWIEKRKSSFGLPERQDEGGNVLPAEYSVEISDVPVDWAGNRQAEYAKIDSMLLEALAEQAEGRPEKMDDYLALREQIKLANPKPSEE